MAHYVRFGRRFPIPSTLQVLHELRALSAEEDERDRLAAVGKTAAMTGLDQTIAAGSLGQPVPRAHR